MRSLWTAASGMKAQQLNIDTISNNLANVGTTGYKKQRTEFKDLFYEKLSKSNADESGGKPVNLEVGHGVMPIATARSFAKGNLEQTNNELDVAIDGDGFFEVRDANDNLFYTRDGSFKISVTDGEARLVTSDGYFVQSDGGDIELGEDFESINVSGSGTISVKRKGEDDAEELGLLKIVTFANRQGLEAKGSNLYGISAVSGEPVEAEEGEGGNIKQGFIETSNVQIVEEMVKMIMAQRAYEINSKSIQTADQMLEQANNLRR
ncbi:MAG: flagellar basal-body rod protein FlgG [Anaeromicrobium sp.]|jgi:flagellar basal-body rod protein FlgG|uniref:flagellar basal-body rod protein FlgG n=1 Tax=Anaeromicrobium sp. TaxID=1929132 RepID=UPI0025E32069|nr:flagellar basal-body rod protein FlgG [Anaeromicrobium sp.]MCT4593944.1 flagellar basal-body rod protein FlgG [Anaeromicrobium sp.]